ncbi:MAG: methylated-DNA--[protein]-cysteine S-methyltransferase [Planctomycetota bacterium]|jgi:O-6-methylguanine DNA methyltransferase
MLKPTKYAVFKTKWGYFGLAGTESALCRTELPRPEREKVESRLLSSLGELEHDTGLFKPLQEQLLDYFEGSWVNFAPDLPIVLDGCTCFAKDVLTACRAVRFGQTASYLELAAEIGQPDAVRAVGGALAKNPLPLIIPCHRIIRSDGKIGGFSAPGGTAIKKRLLQLEQQAGGGCVLM